MFTIQEKTKEEIIKDEIIGLNQMVDSTLHNYKEAYMDTFNWLWNNKHATAGELLEALGGQAYKLFLNAQEVISHITKLDPSYVYPPAPYEFTIDFTTGRVTLGELIIIPE